MHKLLLFFNLYFFFFLGFALTLLNKPDRRWPWTGLTSASKRCPQMQLSNRWVNKTPFPSQQDCTKNQFGLWLLYLTPDGPKVSPSHSPFCLYATGPWFDHQTSNMFSFDLLSWPQSKNLHLVIAQTRSGTDPVHLHALYVVCTQLFYNKNVLNSQQWCGLTVTLFSAVHVF